MCPLNVLLYGYVIFQNQNSEFESLPNGKVADEVDLRLNRKNQRPSSMYETREGIAKVPYWHALKNQVILYEKSKYFYLKEMF